MASTVKVMTGLNTSQRFEIEQLLFKDRKIAAIKVYRESTGADLPVAKAAVEALARQLYRAKPWMFKQPPVSEQAPHRIFGRRTVVLFLLFDMAIFGAAIYWFFLRDVAAPPASPAVSSSALQAARVDAPDERMSPSAIQSIGAVSVSTPVHDRVGLPASVDSSHFLFRGVPEADFVETYQRKLADPAYIARKSSPSASRTTDESSIEVRIKALRASVAGSREAPPGSAVAAVPLTSSTPDLDGNLQPGEWERALSIRGADDAETTIYLQSDGEWLFVGGDARAERTAGGYDQLRVYLHAGLLPGLVNERVHLGRGRRVTSIRQTDIRWQGAPPTSDDERWKRFPVSDWGIYRYAAGMSALRDHRQYELALHLGEAGLQPGVPFTLFVEVETDPQRDAAGRLVGRRYLGHFGSQEVPLWMVIH